MSVANLRNRVLESSTTTGTGTLSLGGVPAGSNFVRFETAFGSGTQVFYAIIGRDYNEWEVGYGTVTAGTPDTLSRTGVIANYLGTTALVDFASVNKDVMCDIPAEKLVAYDATGTSLTLPGALVVTGVTTLGAALTYGGVTLANSVTGTGSMVLSASPTLTGTLTVPVVTATLKGSAFNTADQNAIIVNTAWSGANPRILICLQKQGSGAGGLGIDASGNTALSDVSGAIQLTALTTGLTAPTSLAIGGATIGSNALAVTGPVSANSGSSALESHYLVSNPAGSEAFLAAGGGYTGVGSLSAHPFVFYQDGNEVGRLTSAGTWQITSGGLTVNSGGLTVSSGTSALQAVTATTGVFSSAITINGASAALNVQDRGGVNTWTLSSVSNLFAVSGTSNWMTVGFSTGTVTMPAYGAGAATFNGSGVISSASDERLKHVWGTFGKSMKDIPVNLRNVMIEYGWPDEMGTAYEPLSHYIGQSAQKLQLAVPELVHSKHVLDPKTGKLTDTGRLSVFAPGIDALLWNTAADHESRLDKLEAFYQHAVTLHPELALAA